jgi:ceramide glucosyltransferase
MIAAALAAAYLTVLFLKAWLAVRAARLAPRPGDADPSRVAVVQPVLSGDPGLGAALADNLRSLPTARFIWLVDEDDAPARKICEGLRDGCPSTRVEILVVPPPPVGENPKLFKLERARVSLGDSVLLVLDDDTRMPAGSLSALLEGLERSDASTGLPGCLDDGRWPSRLLAQFVNNNAALTYLPLLNMLPPITINGMAYAMRSETVTAIGGFGPIAGSITDDVAVAQVVMANGRTICQTASPVWVHTTVRDGRHYVRQMHRWFLFAWLLLRRQPPGVQALVSVLHGAPPVALWAAGAAMALHPTPVAIAAFAAVLILRALVLIVLQQLIYGRPLHQPLLSIASELLQPVHVLHALLQRTIIWRTRRYRVRDDQTFEAVP